MIPFGPYCDDDPLCCSEGNEVFLAKNGLVADAEASSTTSYPPISDTGTDRYVSDLCTRALARAVIMTTVKIWTIKHRLTEASEDLYPIRFHAIVIYILITDSHICHELLVSHLIVPSDRGDTEYTAIYKQFRPQRECESGTCYWSQCGGVSLYGRSHRLCAEEEYTSQADEGSRDCSAPQRREPQCRTASAWSLVAGVQSGTNWATRRPSRRQERAPLPEHIAKHV